MEDFKHQHTPAKTFSEGMSSSDSKQGQAGIDEEILQKVIDYNLFRPIKQTELPPGTKVLPSTWGMKQQANGGL